MELKDRYVKADPSPNGPRFCSTCSQYKASFDGVWKISAHGKNRRWICEECMSKRVAVERIK
jgi:protein-arginine kinase activator protein McsA